jgi:hypothetical protein
MTDDNRKKITCEYKDKVLGNLFRPKKENPTMLQLPKEYITYTLLSDMIGTDSKKNQKGGSHKNKRKSYRTVRKTMKSNRKRTCKTVKKIPLSHCNIKKKKRVYHP